MQKIHHVFVNVGTGLKTGLINLGRKTKFHIEKLSNKTGLPESTIITALVVSAAAVDALRITATREVLRQVQLRRYKKIAASAIDMIDNQLLMIDIHLENEDANTATMRQDMIATLKAERAVFVSLLTK